MARDIEPVEEVVDAIVTTEAQRRDVTRKEVDEVRLVHRASDRQPTACGADTEAKTLLVGRRHGIRAYHPRVGTLTDDELDALLEGPPHPEAWRAIAEHLIASEGEELEPLIAKVDAALADWPDELRQTMCGQPWDENLVRGVHDPRHRVVRSVRYDSVFVGRYGGLMMRSPPVEASGLHAMGQSPDSRVLTRVNLRGQRLGPEAGHAFGAATCFDSLEWLDLSGTRLGTEGITALAGARWLRHLRELRLGGDACGDRAALALAMSPNLGALEVLSLANNRISAAGASDLAHSEAFRALRELDLSECDLGPAGAKALGSAPGLAKVAELRLRKCGFGPEGVAHLTRGSLRPTRLSLGSNGIGAAGVASLAGWDAPLTALDLTDDRLGTADLLPLLDAPFAETLEELAIGHNDLEELGPLLALPALERLLVPLNRVGPEAFARAASAARHLTLLEVNDDRMGDDGLIAWAKADTPLTVLRASRNRIGPEGARALGDASWTATLTTLDLDRNPIGDEGGAALAGPLKAIERLHLGDTDVGVAFAEALAASDARPKELFLYGCPIGDAGVAALVESRVLERCETLNLDRCGITDEGARRLATAAPLRRLDVLHLRGNPIGDEGARLLAARAALGGDWMRVNLDTADLGSVATEALEQVPQRCCP